MLSVTMERPMATTKKNTFVDKGESKGGKGGPLTRAQDAASGGFDWWLLTLALILLSIGLIMVLSASGIMAEEASGDKYYFFKRQLLFACAGSVGLWTAALMPRHWLYRLQYPAIFLSSTLMKSRCTAISQARYHTLKGKPRFQRLPLRTDAGITRNT